MKKILVLIAAIVAGNGVTPTVSTAQQKKAVYVQGHLHEYLTDKAQKEQLKYRERGGLKNTTDNIDFSQVDCWAGGVDPDNTYPIDSAVLVVKWTGDMVADRDSILVFGYRWNSQTAQGYAVTKYTIDMIRAVANTDCRFSVLLQNTGGGNFTAGGFGYNFDDNSRVPLTFDENAAKADASINFRYETAPNCTAGQTAIPYSVERQVGFAIDKANGISNITGTGIIDHPFNADYGYPAYDYDYWILLVSNPDYYWKGGWYENYWTYYTKNQPNGPFSAAALGINDRELSNGYVDGFVLNPDPLAWPPIKDMNGEYITPQCECGCNAPIAKTVNKRK
jgi:hypothetical protein